MKGKISIALVGTTHPGNVGAAARAMRVMGLSRLVLVKPRCELGSVARARASGAVELLENARIAASLDAALAETAFVVGTSARRRALGPEARSLRAGVAEFLAGGQGRETVILFGPERNGRDNAALERCNRLWTIPTAPDRASLNLAAAVQVVAYELLALGRGGARPAGPRRELAPAGEVGGLTSHFQRVACEIGFIDAEAPRQALHRVERLCRRVCLERSEVKLLRGFLAAVERKNHASHED